MSTALVVVAVLVGVLIGAVGIGGILLIPALNLLAGLPMHTAMATALLTFVFTGLLGTMLFNRRGSIDWTITAPVCLGAAAFGAFGAWANSRIDTHVLTMILASVITAAGINCLVRRQASRRPVFADAPDRRKGLLLAIGALTGFGSGLTGVGGPALSIPLMLPFGFSTLAVIGTSQVVQILAAVSGTIGHLYYGSIDFRLAGWVTLCELIGVLVGVRLVHALRGAALRGIVGMLCVLVGVALLAKAIAFR